MGQANVTCIQGCTCQSTLIDAHNDIPTSVTGTSSFSVSEAVECVMRIEVMNTTQSGEHKFKVTQVLSRIRMGPK
jgi:hypothetical protein